MARKAKPSRKHRARTKATLPSGSMIDDMQWWRGLANAIAPREKDDWRIGEVATMLQEIGKLLGAHWSKISGICGDSEKQDVTISLSIGINRANVPPEIVTNIGYAQRYRDSLSGKVPDANQSELPFETTATVPEANGEK